MRWYEDSYGMRPWVVITIVVTALAFIIGGLLYTAASGCEQRQFSRPDIHVEWHWNTGCIITNPDQAVVISQ